MLETSRLHLRLLKKEDAPSIQALASAKEIGSAMVSIPHPYPDGEAEKYLQDRLAAFHRGQAVSLAIIEKQQERFSGVIEIRDIEPEHAQGEVSFWLAVGLWGQGYMSEALKSLLSFGFATLKLNRLYAYHMVRNPGSGKVLQKNGFLQEGLLRQRVRKCGVFEDVKLWAILKQDWSDNL